VALLVMTRCSLVSFWAVCLVYVISSHCSLYLLGLFLDPEDEIVRFFEMSVNLCRNEKPHIVEDGAVNSDWYVNCTSNAKHDLGLTLLIIVAARSEI
jgi:hypothetical protein